MLEIVGVIIINLNPWMNQTQ